MRAGHDLMRAGHDFMRAEHDFMRAEHEFMRGEHEFMRGEHEFMRGEHEFMRADNEFMRVGNDRVRVAHSRVDDALVARKHVNDFTRPGHAEILARNALDGVGRLFDALDLGAEARVLGLKPGDVGVQLRDTRPRVLQLGQPAVAENKGDGEDDAQHAGEQNHSLERDLCRAARIVRGDRGEHWA